MKKILYVLLFLILSFIGWLAYMGVFNTVEVIDGREGGYELAGIFHHGSYGNIGATFEEIGHMLTRIDSKGEFHNRIGVCLDTCHVFAAGYPLQPKKSLDDTLRQFDKTIGLSRLKVIHANDSKREQGSHVDRHEGIGDGEIGRAAFKLLVTHPKLRKIPFILETPKEGADGKPDPKNDIRNIKLLRRLEK